MPGEKSDRIITDFHRRRGHVYFAGVSEIGLIKIGHSASPANRIAGLFAWCPWRLELLVHVSGTVFDERKVHAAFMEHHFRGEWFKAAPALLALIEELRQTGELPPHLRGGAWESCPTISVSAETRAKRSASLKAEIQRKRERGERWGRSARQ